MHNCTLHTFRWEWIVCHYYNSHAHCITRIHTRTLYWYIMHCALHLRAAFIPKIIEIFVNWINLSRAHTAHTNEHCIHIYLISHCTVCVLLFISSIPGNRVLQKPAAAAMHFISYPWSWYALWTETIASVYVYEFDWKCSRLSARLAIKLENIYFRIQMRARHNATFVSIMCKSWALSEFLFSISFCFWFSVFFWLWFWLWLLNISMVCD